MLDLADILKPAPSATHPLADNDQPDVDRIVAILTQQQEGIDMLTTLMVEHKAKIAILEGEVRLLRARSDPPKRSSILRV